MKNVLKSILFIVIFIALCEAVTLLLLPKGMVKQYGFIATVSEPILEEQKDTIDVIALGDSLVYSSISPMEIWNEYGYTMYDCAEAAGSMEEAYNSLKIAIKHEHPKIVLFESNMLFRDPNKKPWYFKLKKEILRYFPITKYHNNWKKIGVNSENSVADIDKGYIYVTKSVKYKPIDNKTNLHKARKIIPENMEYLEKMIKLCEEKKIKFVLVSNPSQISWRYSKHYAAVKIAKKHNLDYIDLNLIDELNIDWSHETKDDGDHLNHSGAKKVSSYLGKYLNETELLKDKRNDPKYKSWNKASILYNNQSYKH